MVLKIICINEKKGWKKLPSFIICHILIDLYQKRLISIPKD